MLGSRTRLLPVLALVVSVTTGCMSGMFSDRDRLKMALEEYNDGLRWGRVESSVAHLPLARRQAFAERCAQFQGELEVMDYEVQRIQWDRDHGTATVRVEVSWSLKRRGIVERSVFEQRWQEVGNSWMVAQQKLMAGVPLPLLDEEPAQASAPSAATP